MRKDCAETCGKCPVAPPSLAPTTVDKFPGCTDKSSYCSSYKNYCQSSEYTDYLKKNCRRSCNFCHITTEPISTTVAPTTDLYTVPGGSASLQPGCGKKAPGHMRIVGGKAAKPGDWPWIVTFDYKQNFGNPGHHCGGSLLTSQWILSAAHCFFDDKDESQYSLKLGEHDLGRASGYEQNIPIAEIIFHPSYDPSTYNNDLVLIKLARKATINDRVRTVCLPDQNSTFDVGQKCVIAGWGLLKAYGRGPKILQQAQVPLVSHTTCKASYPYHKVSDNMLCAGYSSGGIDACQGDSGGPLVCKGYGDTWFLWGVVSWGVGCGNQNSYGVYAGTKELRRWVDKIVFKI